MTKELALATNSTGDIWQDVHWRLGGGIHSRYTSSSYFQSKGEVRGSTISINQLSTDYSIA